MIIEIFYAEFNKIGGVCRICHEVAGNLAHYGVTFRACPVRKSLSCVCQSGHYGQSHFGHFRFGGCVFYATIII